MKVVLVEPEIPQNTGNIGRLCVAAGATLIVVGPTGFIISDRRLKRAGMDYWQHLDFRFYPTLDEARKEVSLSDCIFLSSEGKRPYTQAPYTKSSILVFGKESSGLDKAILEAFKDRTYYIPMKEGVRSLNLSNSVAIVLYEAMRQIEGF